MTGATDAVGLVFRTEFGRAVALVTRVLGDIDLAEDAVQDAYATAVARWPVDGVPDNPRAWIVTVARNRAIDRLRRRRALHAHTEELARRVEVEMSPYDNAEDDAIPDERLRLMFTCCHPALAPEAQVALTLRLVAGLTVPEIARALLSSEPAVAQRLVRAKRKLRVAGVPFRMPLDQDVPDRLAIVLSVIYLVFNEGYVATAGDELRRDDIAAEAIRLCRVLTALMPDEVEAVALLALMLLHDSRR
ncbi:MAG: polymerase sigma-70 factor, subfamily, partial [Gaiellales bacterium]|nr:polymerase sigma-70 factor, subfamily [Gaiellales bacterium]